MRPGKIWLKPNRFAKGGGGLRQLTLLLQNSAQRIERLGIIRPSLNCHAQLVRGRRKIALLPERDPERVVHVRLLRIKLFRLSKLRDRLGKFVFEFEGKP